MAVLSEDMQREIMAFTQCYATKQAALLPSLHLIQERFRCVPLKAIEELAKLLDLHPAQVYDAMSFYGFFRGEDRPLGKYRVWVCRSLPCMLRGADELLIEICRHLDIEPGETTPDGSITLEVAECIGACEVAPCVLVNDECKGNLTPESARHLLDELRRQGGENGI